MTPLLFPTPKRPVVLAVVATDRPDALERMVRSLAPVADDMGLHLVVLDNSVHRQDAVRAVVAHAQLGVAGRRVWQRAGQPGSPLHVARLELSAVVDAWCDTQARDAIVWMLDDDLTFEAMQLDGEGHLHVANVVVERIAQVRALGAAHPELALGVGGFTGDPPIRPEAVLATQLGDLSAALERAAGWSLEGAWPKESSPARSGDYYYDHAQHGRDHLGQRFPWIPRAGVPLRVEEQLGALLIEARGIRIGQTPFRPLLEAEDHGVVRFTDAPNRGGNAIFFRRDALRLHPYPAFPMGEAWSRRGDMIGATVLARRQGLLVAEVPVTLRHNRAGQASIEAGVERWVPEFGGVLLARLVMGERLSHAQLLEHVRQLAHDRSMRIITQLMEAHYHVGRALRALKGAAVCWETSSTLRGAAMELDADLVILQTILQDIDVVGLKRRLYAEELAQQVVDAYMKLDMAWGVTRCVGC